MYGYRRPKGLTNHRRRQHCVTPLDSLRQVLFFKAVLVYGHGFRTVDQPNCSCFEVHLCGKYFACGFENGLTSSSNLDFESWLLGANGKRFFLIPKRYFGSRKKNLSTTVSENLTRRVVGRNVWLRPQQALVKMLLSFKFKNSSTR